MCLVVFSSVHELWGGHRGLLCHVLACELFSCYIYSCFGWITALLAINICSLLALMIFVDHCFDHLLCQCSAQPLLPLAGIGPRYSFWVRQVLPLKFLQCDGAGWWPLVGLIPAHRLAMEPPFSALIISWDPHQPLMAPVLKLIF